LVGGVNNNFKICITDICGIQISSKKISSSKLSVNSTEFTDLNLSTGCYFINLFDESQHLISTKKLIKQ
jgi:hypothetical protein